MDYIKQTSNTFNDEPFAAIQTDGCFWRVLLNASEIMTKNALTGDELKRAFHYSIPDYMEDHRNPGQDRCYIKWHGHEEIIRIGFHIIGMRDVSIEYKYRKDYDTGKFVIGNSEAWYDCNFWIAKCRYRNTGHFYTSDNKGAVVWNPASTAPAHGNDILSLRGFSIRVG